MDVQKVTLADAYGNILTTAGVVSQEDGSEFVVGTSHATPVMGLYEAAPSTVDDGDVGVVGMTDDRALRVHVDNAGGGGEVEGDVAHDAADSGNPVKIGGVANTSTPSGVANGDRVNSWYSANGAAIVGGLATAGQDNTNAVHLAHTGGAVDRPGLAIAMYNGSTWDRVRGDTTNGLDVDVTRLPTAVENAFATIDTTPVLRVAVFDDDDNQITSFGGGSGGGGDATLAEQQTQTAHLSEIEGAVEALETAVTTIDTTPLLRVAVFDNNDTQITSFGGGEGGGGGTQWDDGDDIDTNSQGNLILGATGISGTARVIRVDDDGAVHIADGGNSLTVDGTVGVSGTVTVDGSGVTQPVSAASLPLPSGAATSAKQDTIIGHVDGIEGLLTTIDADTGGILTAVQLIDNAISGSEMQVDVVGALPAGSNLIGLVSAGHNTDAIYQGTTSRTVGRAIIDAATSGNNTLLAAQGASNKIRVHSLFLVSAGEVTVRFESGANGTALTGQMNLVANTGFVLPFNPLGWFETAANTLLNLELSAAVSVDGAFQYSVVQ